MASNPKTSTKGSKSKGRPARTTGSPAKKRASTTGAKSAKRASTAGTKSAKGVATAGGKPKKGAATVGTNPKKRASTAETKATKRASTAGLKTRKRAKSPTPEKPAAVAEHAIVHRTVVALCEETPTNGKRARESLERLGYPLHEAMDKTEVIKALSSFSVPAVVLLPAPGGESIVEAVTALGRERPVLVAALAGPASAAMKRCAAIGADLYTLRPHSEDSLAPVMHAASALISERQRVLAVQGTEELLRERLQRYGEADAVTGFQHFDFFKQLLVMEIKRAKRYGYSLGAALVALDPWSDESEEPPPAAVRNLRTKAASAIASCLRDIDLPVDVAEDRFLLFLPYTDIEGAEQVGSRVAAAVKSYGTVTENGRTFTLSVSVGIAALRPGKPVSFARLMRDASSAVRAAQLKGGGRVVVRK